MQSWVLAMLAFGAAVQGADPTCRDFVYNLCVADETSTSFETITNVVDTNECQFFCHEIFGPDVCKFFRYDLKTKECQIWSISQKDYMDTCSIIGGPAQPDFKTCPEFGQETGCDVSVL